MKKLSYLKQLKKLEAKEQKLLNKKENAFYQSNISPLIEKIEEKIPEKLEATLKVAFYKGFALVFEKGTPYIEKTYNKDKIKLEHELNNYAIEHHSSSRHLRKISFQSSQSKLINQSLSALEGGVLGALGIGLPDIPLFIAVIIKTLKQIALNYGYTDESDAEKAYMLTIICGAMAKGTTKHNYNQQIDQLGEDIEFFPAVALNLDDTMKETADLLSDVLLTTKFIQGLPLIGLIGGITNPFIISKIGNYAQVKYEKRYLLQKIKNGVD